MSKPIHFLGRIHGDPHFNCQGRGSFAAFWEDLSLDGYMGYGGTCRRRKFSRISYELSDQNIRVHEDGFLQSREVPGRTVNVHQHRITATGMESGNPTPEGIHRDGVEHVVMLPVARSFFMLSGKPIDATRLVKRIRSVFGLEITVRTLFEAPTAAQLQKALQAVPRPRPIRAW